MTMSNSVWKTAQKFRWGFVVDDIDYRNNFVSTFLNISSKRHDGALQQLCTVPLTRVITENCSSNFWSIWWVLAQLRDRERSYISPKQNKMSENVSEFEVQMVISTVLELVFILYFEHFILFWCNLLCCTYLSTAYTIFTSESWLRLVTCGRNVMRCGSVAI